MEKLFVEELLRESLLKKGDLNGFRETYKKNSLSIRNLNTPQFWDKIVDENYLNNLNESSIYKHKIHIIRQFLSGKNGCLLDIGFGAANIEINLNNNNLQLYGVDISPIAVKKVMGKVKGVFKVSSIYKLPFKRSMFDYVLALDILEHLSPYRVFDAYKEVKRVLKKKGFFIVSIPLNEGLNSMIKKGLNPNGHMRTYTPNIIKAELRLAGFKVVNEKHLYAFKSNYTIKSMILKVLPFNYRDPNLAILIAQKL